ncbi:transposase family protein [Nonomuraea wenchangensis]
MPPDLLQVRVWMQDPLTPGWSEIGAPGEAGAILVPNLPYGSGRRFRFTSIDRSGNTSGPSASATIAAAQLVQGDAATESITAGALTAKGVVTFADKGYQGAGGTVRTLFKHHRHRPQLSRGQKDVNRAHARIRALGIRAIATPKAWELLPKLRCCPHRATTIVQAVLVLRAVEEVEAVNDGWPSGALDGQSGSGRPAAMKSLEEPEAHTVDPGPPRRRRTRSSAASGHCG